MPGYLSSYSHDIFVSYAHLDDAQDWVTRCIADLEALLKSRVGRNSRIHLWLDEAKIRANTVYDDSIPKGLQGSAICLIIGSNNYRESTYCQHELKSFFSKVATDPHRGLVVKDSSRLFFLRIADLETHLLAPGVSLPRTEGFPFFDGSGERYVQKTPDYERNIQRLATEIHHTLLLMAEAPPEPTEILTGLQSGVSERPTGSSQTVFLADCSDRLRPKRVRLENELEARGFSIATDIPPPYEEPSHSETCRAAIQEAALSVHLFDELAGRPIGSGDDAISFAQRQLELGAEARSSQLIFVPERFELARVEDPAYRTWLERLEMETTEEQDFIRSIEIGSMIERVESLARSIHLERVTDPGSSGGVYVDVHRADVSFFSEPLAYLASQGVEVWLSPKDDDPSTNKIAQESRLREVSKVVVVFGQVRPQWVLQRLRSFVHAAMELTNIHFFGVYYAPPSKTSMSWLQQRVRWFKVNALDNTDGFRQETMSPLLNPARA